MPGPAHALVDRREGMHRHDPRLPPGRQPFVDDVCRSHHGRVRARQRDALRALLVRQAGIAGDFGGLADRRDQVGRIERPVAIDDEARHAGLDQRRVERRRHALGRPAARRDPRRCGAESSAASRPSVPYSAGMKLEAWSQTITNGLRPAGVRHPYGSQTMQCRRRAVVHSRRPLGERCNECYVFCLIASAVDDFIQFADALSNSDFLESGCSRQSEDADKAWRKQR